MIVVEQKVSKESHRPVQTVNVEEFDAELGVVFQKSMGEEEHFLMAAMKNIGSDVLQPVTWTSHHASKERDKTDVPKTINCIMPVIDHASNTEQLQLHVMRIAVSYTGYLTMLYHTKDILLCCIIHRIYYYAVSYTGYITMVYHTQDILLFCIIHRIYYSAVSYT